MGLEGQFVDCPPNAAGDPGACPDAAAPATISLTRDDGIVEIGVRTILPDGLELSRHVRVLARDGGDDPSVLAVRAVELLRDLRLTGRRPAPRRPRWPGARRRGAEAAATAARPSALAPVGRRGAARLAQGRPAGGRSGVRADDHRCRRHRRTEPEHRRQPRRTVRCVARPHRHAERGVASGPGHAGAPLPLLPLGPLEPFAAVLTGVNYLRANIPGATAMTRSLEHLRLGAAVRRGRRCHLALPDPFLSSAVEAAAFVTQPDMLVLHRRQLVAGSTGAPSILVSSSAGLTLP